MPEVVHVPGYLLCKFIFYQEKTWFFLLLGKERDGALEVVLSWEFSIDEPACMHSLNTYRLLHRQLNAMWIRSENIYRGYSSSRLLEGGHNRNLYHLITIPTSVTTYVFCVHSYLKKYFQSHTNTYERKVQFKLCIGTYFSSVCKYWPASSRTKQANVFSRLLDKVNSQ
jgi:hypothetical protein